MLRWDNNRKTIHLWQCFRDAVTNYVRLASAHSKTCKSVLKLTAECHCLSYAPLTSHISIVLSRYAFLAYLHRMEMDEKSFGVHLPPPVLLPFL